MKRRLLATVVVALWMASPNHAAAQQPGPAPSVRPTIAVMDFTNSALVRHSDYEPLTMGLQGILSAELRANPQVDVLERQRIQQLLAEQDLAIDGRVDAGGAARVGEVLGVRYMIFGGFVIDPQERVRIDARAVDVETSRVAYVASRTGRADDLLQVIADLALEMNRGMRLPAPPARARPASGNVPPGPSQLRAVMLYSHAVKEAAQGNRAQARTFCEQALELAPEYLLARDMLQQLDGGA